MFEILLKSRDVKGWKALAITSVKCIEDRRIVDDNSVLLDREQAIMMRNAAIPVMWHLC